MGLPKGCSSNRDFRRGVVTLLFSCNGTKREKRATIFPEDRVNGRATKCPALVPYGFFGAHLWVATASAMFVSP